MARMETNGLDAVIEEMTRLGEMTGKAADAMLMAGAAVYRQHWQRSAQMHGHVDTGDMVASVGYSGTPKTIEDARTLDVYPQGKDRKGVRNAEKAFILHYGSSSIKGSRWVEDAERDAERPAQEAMADVWDEFVTTGNIPNAQAPRRARAGRRR